MNKNSFTYASPIVKKETVEEYHDRHGWVTVCPPGQAKGSNLSAVRRWKSDTKRSRIRDHRNPLVPLNIPN
mgnify:CR=1 FL=1